MKTTPPRIPDGAPGRPVPNILRIRLGAALQKHRMQRGLTQAQLAEYADLSLKYVGEIERGEANTTLEVLERLAAAVNWDPMEALEGLREPLTEGVRVMLIGMLRGFIQGFQQMIAWLEALDPLRSRPGVTSSGSDGAVAGAGAEHGTANKPRLTRRRLGGKS